MQIPPLALAIAIEIYIVLLIATIALIFYARKQKSLIRRQQDKLRTLIDTIQTAPATSSFQPAPDIALDLSADIAAEPANNQELEMYKKRVENLEKFKKLFFDLENRWNQAQTNAQAYYNELYAMAGNMEERDRFEMLLGQYGSCYEDIAQYLQSTKAALTGQPVENKTINIIRQDPRAAEEIMKLRNVAADQYRVISNLQRKLEEALSAEQKDLVIKELEQQLQRQMRFVQESDTCVQLLEDELNKAHEQLAKQEEVIAHEHELEEENQLIKETLQNFTHESKELLGNLENLERENDRLKQNLEQGNAEPANTTSSHPLQTELNELRKQYTELEEKYLELKLK